MKKQTKSAIARPPVDDDHATSKEMDKFINKGLGTNEPETKDEQEKICRIQLRLPKSKVEQIDESIKRRDVKVSRHIWFLEAIEEKLKRDYQ